MPGAVKARSLLMKQKPRKSLQSLIFRCSPRSLRKKKTPMRVVEYQKDTTELPYQAHQRGWHGRGSVFARGLRPDHCQ